MFCERNIDGGKIYIYVGSSGKSIPFVYDNNNIIITSSYTAHFTITSQPANNIPLVFPGFESTLQWLSTPELDGLLGFQNISVMLQ